MDIPQITVNGTLKDVSGQPLPGSLRVQLCGFGGQVPRVNGTAFIAQTDPLDVDCPAGSFSFPLWGNDVITPAGTFYVVQVLDDNFNVVQVSAYQFAGAGTFDLSAVAPFNPPPLSLLPLNPVLLNPAGLQTINGDIVITGTLTVNGALASGGLVTLPFSATPVFNLATGNVFEMTLTGNVASSSTTNTATSLGRVITFVFVQDAVGGRTFAWPANVINPTAPDTTPFAISVQSFVARANGNLYPVSVMTVN